MHAPFSQLSGKKAGLPLTPVLSHTAAMRRESPFRRGPLRAPLMLFLSAASITGDARRFPSASGVRSCRIF